MMPNEGNNFPPAALPDHRHQASRMAYVPPADLDSPANLRRDVVAHRLAQIAANDAKCAEGIDGTGAVLRRLDGLEAKFAGLQALVATAACLHGRSLSDDCAVCDALEQPVTGWQEAES